MELWGRNWSRAELTEHIGALSQLGGITAFEYRDGKSKGVSVLRVKTATGFEFSVLPEKGLDIFEAFFQGRSLCWHSPAGVVHPSYYDPRDVQWLKTFAGGLLTSCGLSTAGSPCEDQEEQLGLHGAVSNTPAENVSWREEWGDDELLLTICGKVRESRVFGPNLLVNRTIQSSLSGRSLRLSDRVSNESFLDTPLMQIYHCNFGFPFLTERSRIYCPSRSVEGRTPYASLHQTDWQLLEAPNLQTEERCYYHAMAPEEDGLVHLLLVSDDSTKDFAVEMRYSAANLPQFIEWKMTQPGHFVLGLEPATCRADGRKAERASGRLCLLKPGETKEFSLEFRVLSGVHEVAAAIRSR